VLHKCGREPEGCECRVTRNAHDFGTYLDVSIFFDAAARGYAYRVEAGAPSRWDSE